MRDLPGPSDLESRLRATVGERSDAYSPSPDLPERIGARVAERQRSRRLATGGVVLAAAAAVAAVVALVIPGGGGEGSIRMTDPPVVTPTIEPPTTSATTTSTTAPSTSSTATPPTSTTAPPGFEPDLGLEPGSNGDSVEQLTPLNPSGIGPIEAGMTVAEANEAAGATIAVGAARNGCAEGTLPGADGIVLMVDAGQSVVRAVSGPVVTTDDDLMIGMSRDELVAAMGQPASTEDRSASIWGSGAEMLIYPSGGGNYGVLVADDMVLGLASGQPDWFFDADGCP